MKPFLILLISLLSSLTSNGQLLERDSTYVNQYGKPITKEYFNPSVPVPDSGFTNKAEAKNLIVFGKKEGKWFEFVDYTCDSTIRNGRNYNYYSLTLKSDSNAFYFRLTVYKADIPSGIARVYNRKNGKLFYETTYINGKENGVRKTYSESGKVVAKISFTNGYENGIAKYYYESGELESETPYTNGKLNGVEKDYDENGKVRSEYTYKDGVQLMRKQYDERGNEIISRVE